MYVILSKIQSQSNVFFTENPIPDYYKGSVYLQKVQNATRRLFSLTLSTIAWKIYPWYKQHAISIYTLYEYHLSLLAISVNMMLFVSVYTHAHGIHHYLHSL